MAIKAKSYKELLFRATEYRISRRKDWQNLQDEINAYIASISPDTVQVVASAITTKPETNLFNRTYNWLSRTYDKLSASQSYCTGAEAERRSNICANCNYNMVAGSGCNPCNNQVKRMSQAISKNRKTSLDYKLHSCGKLNLFLKSAVHLEEDLLGEKVSDESLPQNCWRKQ